MRYSIPEENIEKLEKKIVRIRNKCAKYGCEFKYERVGDHFEEFDYEDEETGKKFKKTVHFIDVECEGVARINGWKFAATLEYSLKGNIIAAVPGVEIPSRFYDCEPWCEHCKTRRDRKVSYVVQNEESGEFKQVGRGCLVDFTGGLSAEWAAQIESFFKEFEEASEYVGCGGFGKTYFKVRDFLVFSAETIRLFGFVKNGYDSGISTADRARSCYLVRKGYRASKLDFALWDEASDRGFDEKRAESIELADKVLDWILNNENTSNYFHNLKVVCSDECFDACKVGLVASAVQAYSRELEIQIEKDEWKKKKDAEAEKSGWVGEVGKRVSFATAEVTCVTSWETMYGVTSIYKIVDESGNVFTWKTSSDISGYWEGKKWMEVVKITGTVKEHKEYRGVKQTELTRCRVEWGVKKDFFDKPKDFDEESAQKAQNELEKAFDEFFDSLEKGA